MELANLFQMQKELGKVGLFNYRGPDRFNKLILALLVELGECANEWRGFKFWSKNQRPRTSAVKVPAMMEEDKEYYNPLLEEFVDGLHFILEIGIEIADEIQFPVSAYFRDIEDEINLEHHLEKNITDQFRTIFYYASTVSYDSDYQYLFAAYFHLGEMLGFTWEEVVQAYQAKNAINQIRQDEGY